MLTLLAETQADIRHITRRLDARDDDFGAVRRDLVAMGRSRLRRDALTDGLRADVETIRRLSLTDA